ncbi:NAD(P)/FAD-dependent oxidoreductase [Nakamurella flava]|uniref:NAD(P)/FAD-dependent oxidoreductase n=1 Tax=Nakamurella flava TaxID=2576308 RepID=A0A4U6Q977_9ACTN|nr:NAD(P)/FAD-dependent oxidoreductase [Nakamurella flava]TKV56428.1 NAD(P)/FAD-dependent oxidoreductase [Nakamurella flava]
MTDQLAPGPPEGVDVVIVGAGLSGIGAACQYRQAFPDLAIAVLEERAAIGGTWDLFRYPGVRSDSDMSTLGYSFRPFGLGLDDPPTIADGALIRDYIEQTAREFGVDRCVRFGHRVVRADWNWTTARWTVTAETTGPDGRRTVRLSARWLSACAGYYDTARGHRPALPGADEFTGVWADPQHWPADLDWTDRRVVVIGSGATAISIVPALAQRAARVTMLQRTPSDVLAIPRGDALSARLRRVLPPRSVARVVRGKNAVVALGFHQFARRLPTRARRFIQAGARRSLPPSVDVDVHFAPPYAPWDQRVCFVPDGDLFQALSGERAEIVTDHIDTLTPDGIRLRSGRHLPADVIVPATGLQVRLLGGLRLHVDGALIEPQDTVVYKGTMLSGVPNFNQVVGYPNASWTLKADLASGFVVRVLRELGKRGADWAVPDRPDPADVSDRPLLDLQSGYIRRAAGTMPRQGRRGPWRMHQNWLRDVVLLRWRPVTDTGLRFGRQPGHPNDGRPQHETTGALTV